MSVRWSEPRRQTRTREPTLELMQLDSAALIISLALMAGYYIFMFYRIRRNPEFTIHSVNEKTRQLWVREVMSNHGKEVLAVQTLRNFVMAASFKASSAILLIMGTLTLSGQADNMSKTWHVFNVGGSSAPQWWLIKVMCLLTVLIVAFFAFALAIRLLNHVVFMVTLPPSDALGLLSPERVAQRLNHAGSFYRVGTRALFLTVPLVFWLFGPVFLIAATIGLVIVLYFLDRNPLA